MPRTIRTPRPSARATAALVALLAAACATARPAATAPAAPRADAPAPPELVTDRPDFTESAVTVPRRSLQLEMGHSVTRDDATTERTLGELLLRVGLHRRVELRVAGNSVVVAHDRAAGGGTTTAREDAGVGVKLALVPERAGRRLAPTTALIVGTSLPTGSPALRSGALTPEAKLALGWTIAEGWQLGANANLASVPDRGTRAAGWVGSLSLGHDLGERLGAYAEVYGGGTSRGERTRFANAGVTLAVAPLLQLDARAGAGLGPSAGVRFLGVGLARRW